MSVTYTGGTGLFLTLNVLTVSMTVEFNNSYINPGFDLTVNGIDGFGYVRIRLVDPEGVYPDQIIRGTDMLPVTSDVLLVTDYEFPQFRSGTYILEMYDDDKALVDTLSIDTEDLPGDYFVSVGSWPNVNAWLRSISQPELTRPCIIEEYPSWTQSGRILSNDIVLGRSNPVIQTDVMGGREGDFKFLAGRGVQYNPGVLPRDVDFLVAEGDVLMLHVFDDLSLNQAPLFLRVTQISMERIGRDGHSHFDPVSGTLTPRTDMAIRYMISYVEVDRPATSTDLVSAAQWLNVKDHNGTFQDVKDYYATWLDVLANPTKE